MIVSFKFFVMNFVDFVIDCYSHITSHVSQVFASCTHYTSYSLLNFVHVIVCVYGLTNQVIANTLNYVQTKFVTWKFVENAKFCFENFGLKILDLKNIPSHTHAFLFLKLNALSQINLFFKNCVFPQKYGEPLPDSIGPFCFSTDRNF